MVTHVDGAGNYRFEVLVFELLSHLQQTRLLQRRQLPEVVLDVIGVEPLLAQLLLPDLRHGALWVRPHVDVLDALVLQLLDEELDDLLTLQRHLRVLLHADLLHLMLEAEEVGDLDVSALVEARPVGILRMDVVAALLKDLNARRERLVGCLDGQLALLPVEEVLLDEVTHVEADDFLEDVRRVHAELAAAFCVPARSIDGVVGHHAVEHDWHLRAGGETTFVGLEGDGKAIKMRRRGRR